MTEEKRDCTNCGNGIICACTAFNHWQPIAQEKGTMGKIQYTQQEWASIIDDLGWNPDVMEELKQKGYIRKSAVEEAEEYEKHFARIMDLGLSCTIKDLEYSMRIIERLKSEIAMLKK